MLSWRAEDLVEGDGVIISCGQAEEWMLPWWWLNYRIHNSFPVTFVDMGLSPEGRSWCKERGELLSFVAQELTVSGRERVDPAHALIWESLAGEKIWKLREGWFKRAFLLLKSPYKRTLWVAPSCQIRGPLDEIFPLCENKSGASLSYEKEESLALQKERGILRPDEKLCKINVLVFKRGSPLILEWADRCQKENHRFLAEPFVLAHLMEGSSESPLPEIYNWQVSRGANPQARINDYGDAQGTQKIAKQISKLTENMLLNLSVSSFNYQ
ncbi:MAG: hypothetical protein HYX48_03730 [Chlamydiales bacterium]|nr:hypothetical protein [Chlamydiales bacterium]